MVTMKMSVKLAINKYNSVCGHRAASTRLLDYNFTARFTRRIAYSYSNISQMTQYFLKMVISHDELYSVLNLDIRGQPGQFSYIRGPFITSH